MSSSLSPDEIKEQNDTDSFIVQMHIAGHVDTCKKNFPPDVKHYKILIFPYMYIVGHVDTCKNFPPDLEYYKISSNKTILNPARLHIVGHDVACKKTSHQV